MVGNDSRDGTLELVKTSFPSVTLVFAPANLGFARATNIGIRESNAEYVLALNPDTRVSAGALEAMIDIMEDHAEVGIAGPRLIREDGSLGPRRKTLISDTFRRARPLSSRGSAFAGRKAGSVPCARGPARSYLCFGSTGSIMRPTAARQSTAWFT